MPVPSKDVGWSNHSPSFAEYKIIWNKLYLFVMELLSNYVSISVFAKLGL